MMPIVFSQQPERLTTLPPFDIRAPDFYRLGEIGIPLITQTRS